MWRGVWDAPKCEGSTAGTRAAGASQHVGGLVGQGASLSGRAVAPRYTCKCMHLSASVAALRNQLLPTPLLLLL
jgi:hypothetical protein